MSMNDYTDPLYSDLVRLTDHISLLGAYLSLLPDSADTDSSIEIVKKHHAFISASLDDVWTSNSRLTCGLLRAFDARLVGHADADKEESDEGEALSTLNNADLETPIERLEDVQSDDDQSRGSL